MLDVYKKRDCCAICQSTELETILDLGQVPLAGFFPKDKDEETLLFPLELQFCKTCTLVQTDSVINPDVLFKDYRYMSSVGLSGYFKGVAKELDEKFKLADKSVLEFGCNDGALLEPLSKVSKYTLGVDPSVNISQLAKNKGLNVKTTYFNFENFGTEEYKEQFDLIVSNNTFAHIIDINEVVKTIEHCLKDKGHFVFEVHYLGNLYKELQWDNVYHEHIYYYSVSALNYLFSKYNLSLVDVEKRDIHSGSIRVTVQKDLKVMSKQALEFLEKENETFNNVKYIITFSKDVKNHIEAIKEEVAKMKVEGKKIAGYGASGRANMFCNITNLTNKEIEFIVDDSPERCNRYIANTDIPIVNFDTLANAKDIDVLIIFAWNYSKMIMEKTKHLGFKYFVAFPEAKYVSPDKTNNFVSL